MYVYVVFVDSGDSICVIHMYTSVHVVLSPHACLYILDVCSERGLAGRTPIAFALYM